MAAKPIGVPGAVLRAMRVVNEHPAMRVASPPKVDPSTRATTLDIEVQVELPFSWMARGQSPNGVGAAEPVALVFPAEYPLCPPRIYLRSDFDRTLAHVQPGPATLRPEPCVFEGDLEDLFGRSGLAGVLNQLVGWLEDAALGRLIDPGQGWEPVRRDSLRDVLVFDADSLRSQVKKASGHAFLPLEWVSFQDEEKPPMLRGKIENCPLTLNAGSVCDYFRIRNLRDGLLVGRSVVLFVWPGRRASGRPVVADDYMPETVTTLADLKNRAQMYGCKQPLGAALRWLAKCVDEKSAEDDYPVGIVLCARRPFHLIGSDSELELCPYLVDISAPELFPNSDDTLVRPAGHRHAISVPLLRRLSAHPETDQGVQWVLAGCGSLGSKIGLHLARSGLAPSKVIDRGDLSPHNVARHALVPTEETGPLSWVLPKATALADAIGGLGQVVEAHVEDIREIALDKKRARLLLPAKAWAVVNSTASVLVRDALAMPECSVQSRVIETTLFGQGGLGVMTVEGPERNPDTGDLITETYERARRDEHLAQLVFGQAKDPTWQNVGQGCGSLTMAMPDTRVSLFASAMAEWLRVAQGAGLPERGGCILLGSLSSDGIGLTWQTVQVSPVIEIAPLADRSWRVRILARAQRKIDEEVARWPTSETGGVLLGRTSEATRTFYVVDTLPAPRDSTRSASEFVLGTDKLRSTLSEYAESTDYCLYCLGTWHSHLVDSGPSARDHRTATTVALARLAPSVLLIRTPNTYRAILA